MRSAARFLLSRYGGSVVTRGEVAEVARRFDLSPNYLVKYTLDYGYALRILRGLYYVRTVREFELEEAPNVLDLLSRAMDRLGARWHFGLWTALRLNGMTHEYHDVVYVLNDAIRRPKPVRVAGERVRFLRIRPSLLEFGVATRGVLRFSDPEKTVLDFLYLSRYGLMPRESALALARSHLERLDLGRLREYLARYPGRMRRWVERELL